MQTIRMTLTHCRFEYFAILGAFVLAGCSGTDGGGYFDDVNLCGY